ncbi:MAG: hypothetical protein GY953_42230, partial [bacterium]|nr:hypothetical protein [bacterium]
MRNSIITLALLILLITLVAAVPAPHENPAAPVLLWTEVIQVKGEARALDACCSLPEGATWATVKNNSAGVLYIGATAEVSAANGWPVGPGDERTFSLDAKVFLFTTLG